MKNKFFHFSRQKYSMVILASIILLSLLFLTLFKPQSNKGPVSIDQVLNAKIPNLALSSDDIVKLEDGIKEGKGPDGIGVWSIYIDKENKPFVIADFNNDGWDDIAVVIGASGGGSGYFSYLTIFMNNNGNLKYLTSTEIGDRIKIQKVSYNSDVILTDIITQGPDEGLCCGTLPKTLKHKVTGKSLSEII